MMTMMMMMMKMMRGLDTMRLIELWGLHSRKSKINKQVKESQTLADAEERKLQGVKE